MFYQKRLIIFGSSFFAIVILDGLKFIAVGGPNIINWHSFIHPGWVFVTLALFFLGVWRNTRIVWKALFGIYLVVFLFALANQYVPFSSVLTYNCMLFNLIFVSLYFFLSAPKIS